MTEEARVLTRELLRRHEQVCRQFGIEKPYDVTDGMVGRSVITCGALCNQVGVPFLTRGAGRFLRETAEWCGKNGWPPLNALAVNSESNEPGDGYDEAPGCALMSWPEDVKRCIAFSRYPSSSSI